MYTLVAWFDSSFQMECHFPAFSHWQPYVFTEHDYIYLTLHFRSKNFSRNPEADLVFPLVSCFLLTVLIGLISWGCSDIYLWGIPTLSGISVSDWALAGGSDISQRVEGRESCLLLKPMYSLRIRTSHHYIKIYEFPDAATMIWNSSLHPQLFVEPKARDLLFGVWMGTVMIQLQGSCLLLNGHHSNG